MSKLSLDKFVELLQRSNLIESDQVALAVGDWKRSATLSQLDDAQHLADHLVDRGRLTHWQCKKLLEGRHRGFYLGKYKLLDHLGSGGMSSVYLAEHVLMQRRVAVKVLPQNRVNDSSYLARFHFEAQAAAALDHPNIVRAYDLDGAGRIHYLVMEYVEGHDLHTLVCQDGPIDYYTAANYVAQAAAGLEHAHQCGLVHRDIKPANLLVDGKGTVKILDMGLAKFTAETRPAPRFAQDEHVLGTADYLAPEQAVNSQTVDGRADIYALGCTLYFLLTGHPPFAAGTSLERIAAHQQQVPPSVLVDRPDAPASLLAICRQMMEKSADNRYQTAGEVRRVLSAWLESEGSSARAVSPVAARRGNMRWATGQRQAESKANLVSGSAADLHNVPADSPHLSPSLTDTDSNLRRATVKMPASRGACPSGSSDSAAAPSEVLPIERGAMRGSDAASSGHCPPHLPPPPVVAPPVAAPLAPPRNVAPASSPPPTQASPSASDVSNAEAADANFALVSSAELAGLARARKRLTDSSWAWLAVLTALVAGAALLAAVAL